MDPTLKFYSLLLLLGLVFVDASSSKIDLGYCEKVVKKWTFSSLEQEFKEDKHTLKDLLFFLHVPRTGGRTYFHCFLRKLYSSSFECPRSYDKLRFDPSKQECRLLVTHDDYSLMSKLPSEKTSVVTILRDPVDRVFSTYEFSIEVAARFLVHPNLTSATQIAGQLRSKTRGISTLDIWPWKYLVPWMREDLFSRRDAGKYRDLNEVKSKDVYNMEERVMPLHEYIYDPIAQDIIHNGATFQIAGLTNNSYTAESHAVRRCVQKYKHLGQYVLQVAKKRLDNMLYVGLTEEHRESATMFANVVGSQVISQLRASNSKKESEAYKKSERSSSFSNVKLNSNDHQNSTSGQEENEIVSPENGEAIKQNMTAVDLMDAYEECISTLRKSQSRRRTSSLKRISPVNFTKEARHQVPEIILEQIISLNDLDLELYKYAKEIFSKQHTLANNKFVSMESLGSLLNISYDIAIWKILYLGVTVILLLFALIFVNSRRRTSKIKI